ncbi:MAG: LytTR family DNA-binding domain-containing protein [Erysipelotrichales bacterium]
MKVKVDIRQECDEEIIIVASNLSQEIEELVFKIENLLHNDTKIKVFNRESELYLSVDKILFIETENEKVYAHTKDKAYLIKMRLYELEAALPNNFLRISKSAIVNTSLIHTIDRKFSSTSRLVFDDSHKEVYVSRRYYKDLKTMIAERSI